MPIYEYRCLKCGFEFEAFVLTASDEDDIECPKCGATERERVLSLFSSCAGSSGGCGPATGGFS